jgi:hypothetical protein
MIANRVASVLPSLGVGGWWSQTGSNRRPHACKARALPTELWPLTQGSQESLSSVPPSQPVRLVGPGRLELPTLRLSGVRSNQLSYGPMAAHAPIPAASLPASAHKAQTQIGTRPAGSRSKSLNLVPHIGTGRRLMERETKTAASRLCIFS